MNANDNDDLDVNEIDETLGNPKGSQKDKVGGDAITAKRAARKISNPVVKLKAP